MTYPLKMQPVFRCGAQTPWGGHLLRDYFGKAIPDDQTGESLEAGVLDNFAPSIENGPLAGKTLREAYEQWGKRLTGVDCDVFPLYVKLLDAREMLSVQVEPNRSELLGAPKTKAWVVLAAPRGSRVICGVDLDGRTLEECAAAHRLEEVLRVVPVIPGDVLYLPSGMVHALGGDVAVYEVQPRDDSSLRFWDWERKAQDGYDRPLAFSESLEACKPNLPALKLPGVTDLVNGGSVTHYIEDDHFSLSRLNISGEMPLPSGRMLVLTSIGTASVTWDGGEIQLAPGGTAIIPADFSGAVLRGLRVLCATTPDRDSLKARLDYRAEGVAGL